MDNQFNYAHLILVFRFCTEARLPQSHNSLTIFIIINITQLYNLQEWCEKCVFAKLLNLLFVSPSKVIFLRLNCLFDYLLCDPQSAVPCRIIVPLVLFSMAVVLRTANAHQNAACTLESLKDIAKNACDHLSDKFNETHDPFHRGRDSLGFHLSHGK